MLCDQSNPKGAGAVFRGLTNLRFEIILSRAGFTPCPGGSYLLRLRAGWWRFPTANTCGIFYCKKIKDPKPGRLADTIPSARYDFREASWFGILVFLFFFLLKLFLKFSQRRFHYFMVQFLHFSTSLDEGTSGHIPGGNFTGIRENTEFSQNEVST